MDSSFKTEDQRKDRLWEAWFEQLNFDLQNFEKLKVREFESFYEGLVQVVSVDHSKIVIALESGEKILNFVTSSKVRSEIRPEDSIYLEMGLYNKQWWPTDIISMSTIISHEEGKVHMSMNPILMSALQQRGMH